MSLAEANAKPYVKRLSLIGLLLSILGLADSTYLTISHFTAATILACPESSFVNCAKVTTSSYSYLFGIPVVILGLAFFVTMVVLQSPWLWASSSKLIYFGRLVTSVIGIGMVGWLIFAEFYRLHSICLYCSGVHLLTFCLLAVTLIGSSLISPQDKVKLTTSE